MNLTKNDLFDGKKVLDHGLPPEEVYLTHARQVEKAGISKEDIDRINKAPLILFTNEKAKRALDWDKESCGDTFRMPFENCTVVDSAGAVTFLGAEYVTPHKEPALFRHLWEQLEHVLIYDPKTWKGSLWKGAPPGEAIGVRALISICPPGHGSALHVIGGMIIVNKLQRTRTFLTSTHNVLVFQDGRVLQVLDSGGGNMPAEFSIDANSSSSTALAQLQYLSKSPSHLVQITPSSMRDPAKSKKVIRPHERNRIVLLDPDEVRSVRENAGGTHESPIPHTRRGHSRTFRSPRYTKARGQTVWIDPIDVLGGEPWNFGGKTYVVLDKTGADEDEKESGS